MLLLPALAIVLANAVAVDAHPVVYHVQMEAMDGAAGRRLGAADRRVQKTPGRHRRRRLAQRQRQRRRRPGARSEAQSQQLVGRWVEQAIAQAETVAQTAFNLDVAFRFQRRLAFATRNVRDRVGSWQRTDRNLPRTQADLISVQPSTKAPINSSAINSIFDLISSQLD